MAKLKIRIKLKSFDNTILDAAAQKIADTVKGSGANALGPIPLPVVIMVVLAALTWFFLSHTKWGRIMYAIGANPEASRLAGVKVGFYRGLAYVMSGVFASIAGLILASRIGQGDVNAGASSLLEAIAVALVGTSVLGIGKPNAWGTITFR